MKSVSDNELDRMFGYVQLSTAQHFCTRQYNAMSTGRKEDSSLFKHLDRIFIHRTSSLPCVSATTTTMILSVAMLTRSRAHIVFERVYVSP